MVSDMHENILLASQRSASVMYRSIETPWRKSLFQASWANITSHRVSRRLGLSKQPVVLRTCLNHMIMRRSRMTFKLQMLSLASPCGTPHDHVYEKMGSSMPFVGMGPGKGGRMRARGGDLPCYKTTPVL
jgi:hypothetical protein